MTIQQARLRAEVFAGQKLDEPDFQEVLAYTRHKAKITGHDEDYVPLLLYDEVKDHIFREQINWISSEAKTIGQEIDRMMKRGEWPCVIPVSTLPV